MKPGDVPAISRYQVRFWEGPIVGERESSARWRQRLGSLWQRFSDAVDAPYRCCVQIVDRGSGVVVRERWHQYLDDGQRDLVFMEGLLRESSASSFATRFDDDPPLLE